MVISHYGRGMVKITQGEVVVCFNPIGEGAEVKPTRFGAGLALVSLQDVNYNGVEEVTRGDRVPFVINGPGEYEVSGIFVRGFAATGPAAKINTTYTLVLDDIKVVHLGALAGGELPAEAAEALSGPDLLFVPIGGGERLEAKQAAKLATALAAKLVVPVDYEDDEALKIFLKEMGAEQVKPLESLTLRRKDLADKEGEVTVIKSW